MLKSLDILIGLSVVMLIVSMAVTLINQAILHVLAKRGSCLRDGVADLLQHLDWKMPRKAAEDIAAMVLTQPSVRKTKLGPILGSIFPSLQFGEVIHREELTKLLLRLGSLDDEIRQGMKALQVAVQANVNGAEQLKVDAAVSSLISTVQGLTGMRGEFLHEIVKSLEEIGETNVQAKQLAALAETDKKLSTLRTPLEKIVTALAENGITDPGKTLENVRMMSLQLEKSSPDQASDLRHSTALLQEAFSPFLAKINFAFDQTMDRVSERYTYNARIVTVFSAALVALVLQLDSVYLFNRLSMDDKMREALVNEAARVVADDVVKKTAAVTTPANAPATNAPAAHVPAAHASAAPALATPALAAPAPAATAPAATAPAATAPAATAPAATAPAATAPAAHAPAAHAPAAGGADPKGGQQAQPKAPQPGTPQKDDALAEAKTKYYLNFLAQQGVIRLPVSFDNWVKEWKNVNYAGVILSILLLSMGAPFWYKAVGKLLQFRSLLAQKDDDQRITRQTVQAPEKPGKPGAAPTSALPQGERGDLKAIV